MADPSPLLAYLSAPVPLSLPAEDLARLLAPFGGSSDARPLSLAILSRALDGSTTSALLSSVTTLLASPVTRIAGLDTLTALLQVAPPTALSLLASPALAQAFASTVTAIASSKPGPVESRTALVQLLVEAASVSALRAQVRDSAGEWLESVLVGEQDALVQATAAVAVIKLRLGSEPADERGLDAIGAQLASLYTAGAGDVALEGLSYLTLGGTKSASPIKSALVVPDSAFLAALLPTEPPRQRAAPSAYTLATLLHHLTLYPPLSAAPALPAALAPAPEARELVSTRNATLLTYALLPTLATLAASASSSRSTGALTAQVYLALTEPQAARPALLAAGVAKALRQLVDLHDAAVHATARLLITADPSLVFSPAPLHSTALVLAAALPLHPDDLLRTFELLMALTNIASLGGPPAEALAPSLPTIEALMLSPNTMVRRAASELACNLVGNSDGGVEWYESRPGSVEILLALCGSEDQPTSEAASGAVAALVEATSGVAFAVFASDKGCKALLSLVESGEEGCWVRGWDWVRSLGRWLGERVEGAEPARAQANKSRRALDEVRDRAEGQERFEADESMAALDRGLAVRR